MKKNPSQVNNHYFRTIWAIIVMIGAILILIGSFRENVLSLLLHKKPKIAVAIVPLSGETQFGEIFTKRIIGYTVQDTMEIPIVLKTANVTGKDVIVESVEGYCNPRSCKVKENKPIEVWRIEHTGYVRSYTVIDDSPKGPISSGFPLIVKDREEKTVKFYVIFYIHRYKMTDTPTEMQVFGGVKQVKITIHFQSQEDINLIIPEEKIPMSCLEGFIRMVGLGHSDKEDESNIQKIIDAWGLNEDEIVNIQVRRTGIGCTPLGSADMLRDYVIRYIDQGVTKEVTVRDWEIENIIPHCSLEEFVKNKKTKIDNKEF